MEATLRVVREAVGPGIGWAALYLALWKVSPVRRRHMWAQKMTSGVHAVTGVASFVGVVRQLSTQRLLDVTAYGKAAVGFRLPVDVGFYLFDTVLDVGRGRAQLDDVLHHTVLLGGMLAYNVFRPHSTVGDTISLVATVMHLSTPFLYGMWWLREAKQRHTKAYAVVGLTFAVSFFLCRVVFWPVVLWWYRHASSDTGLPSMTWKCHVGSAVLMLLNLYWFRNIVANVRRSSIA